MIRRAVLAAILTFVLGAIDTLAAPPPRTAEVLRRGINITGWFRFPASRDPAALRRWMPDSAIADLRAAGFTFVRLAADPDVLDAPGVRDAFLDQIRRLQRAGLAVVISPHPVTWNLDANAADRERLAAFWRVMAPALRGFDPRLTLPELLNEPVFHADPSRWWRLQHAILTAVRTVLPAHTVILTGADWGGIGGLLALPPEADANVVYSFHFYDPTELTSLAAWRPGVDRAAFARLPFPERDPAACRAAGDGSPDKTTREMIVFYCATVWDAAHVRAQLLRAANWASRNKAVLLAGEFGAAGDLNAGSRLAWLRLVRETCEENGIHWALWGYDDQMGLGVRRPVPARPVLDRAVLDALGLRGP